VSVHVAGSGKHFDERRNSSRVLQPPPDALDKARRALARVSASEREWIAKRQRGEHDHAAMRADGSRAACPVWDCREPLAP
jgi:hypothetical protein